MTGNNSVITFSNTGDTWDDYFKDNELLTQIDKDARRLYPDLGFFSFATRYPADEFIDPNYKLGMLKDRVNRSNLGAVSSRRGRNGAKLMMQTSQTPDDGDYTKRDEEANWEGNTLLIQLSVEKCKKCSFSITF